MLHLELWVPFVYMSIMLTIYFKLPFLICPIRLSAVYLCGIRKLTNMLHICSVAVFLHSYKAEIVLMQTFSSGKIVSYHILASLTDIASF